MLQDNHVHRLPILESDAQVMRRRNEPHSVEEPVLCWIGWKRVLRCISGQLRVCSEWQLLKAPLRDSRVGTWTPLKPLYTVTRATPVRAAIALFIDKHLTALPVLETPAVGDNELMCTASLTTETMRMIDVFTKQDIAEALVQLSGRHGRAMLTANASNGKAL
jgi:hypothetical protein